MIRWFKSLWRWWRPAGMAAASGLTLSGRPTYVTLDYQACVDARCEHYPHCAMQPSPAAIVAGEPLRLACPAGHPIGERWVHGKNTVLTVAINNIIGQMFGNASTYVMKPLYLAAGTSTAGNVATTTGLTAEFGRVTCGVYQAGAAGPYYTQLIVNAFLSPTDCNANLQEFALMAGAATATLNSGTALGRALYGYGAKDSSKTVTIVWTITGAST